MTELEPLIKAFVKTLEECRYHHHQHIRPHQHAV